MTASTDGLVAYENARPAVRRKGIKTTPTLLAPSLLLILAGLVVPLLLMLRYSFNSWTPGELMISALTLENYVRFFSDSFYLGVLFRTLWISLVSTLACLVLGLPTAYYLSRLKTRWLKTALILAIVIPLLMGNAVRVVGWIVLLADRGLVNEAMIHLGVLSQPVRILYTANAVAIGLIAVLLPFMIISLQAVFDGVSESYEEAAMSLGARPLTMFYRVLLPLIIPGIFSGCLLCFVLAMNAYATPVLIGGPSFHMMAPKVYEQALKVFNWPFAASMAFILMAVTLVLTISASLALQRRYGKV
ncbi:ABC transporter permease [Bradyrhizobium sp. LHD-71]|uniref:ABC transporter permease n=1 Tax=Bradyrhizobium sp. LHD-71 TaxID=3072141 RepID=UPI00280C7BAA|nr:ABC transporter permease [Bradyrhizobium sp. LHD-71]MDQ8732328.1 ABC transporter permease [Bradyrhizobium sp. LHD-71]